MSANQTRPLKERVKSFGAAAIRERRRHDFLVELVEGADVFDIGCGNDSPYKFKAVRSDIRYVGLDVVDYNQEHEPTEYADEYLSVPEYYGPLPPGDVIALGANPTVLARLTGADPARIRAVAPTGTAPDELPPAEELLRELAQAIGLQGAERGFEGAAS